MKNLTTTRAFVFSVVLLTLSIVLYVSLFLIIRSDNRTISETQGKIENALREEQQLNAAQFLVRDITDEENELNTFFISSDGVVSFLEMVESLGDDTGASIEVRSVELETLLIGLGKKEDEFVEFLRLNISIEGSWREAFHTISLLEGMPLGVFVHQISLDKLRGESNEWEGLMDISFTKLK